MRATEAERSRSAGGATPSARWASDLRPRRTRALFIGAALVVFGMIALVPWMIWDARRLAWDRAVQSSENLTTTLAHDIERNTETYDLSLQGLILALRLPEGNSVSAEARNQILFDRAATATHFGSVLVLDETGQVVVDSHSATPRSENFADRDFFRAHRDGDPGLFISAPFRGDSPGEWLIALSRPLERQKGRFSGVVVGSMRLGDFRRLFERVDLGPSASVTLFNLDRTMLVRVPYDDRDVGRVLQNAPIFRHRSGAASGSFVDTSAVDGVERLFTFTQIGDFPLMLVLGQSSAVILSEWRQKAATIGLVVLGLVGVATLLGGALRAELRHRSHAERELARKNATLSAILREMPDGVQVFDPDGRLIAWNEQVFELADLGPAERDEILSAPDPARAFRLMLAVRGDYGPGDPAELVAGREDTARAGSPTHFRRQGVSGRWLDIRGVPTADGGWLASYRDVSEEVGREHELRDASERLEEQAAALCATAEDLAGARAISEEASRSKSAFLANMSHELRTPLNGVIGFADLMLQESFGPLGHPRYVEYSRDIGESGRHLLELINDILDFSKADAGKLELQEDEVDVVATAAAAIRMVRARAESAELTLELRNELSDRVVGARADERRLKQIVLNLVSNAIKFTSNGGRIVVAVADGLERGGIVISVSDTGIGIAPEDLPRVMEAFGQIDHGLNRRHNGTGLGLPLSKHLAELHGGELRIESTPNLGTTVTVWLPEDRVLRYAEPALLEAQ